MYLRLKISVQGPFNTSIERVSTRMVVVVAMQPYRVHPKSKCWTVAVQLTEVTSCRRVPRLCLFCQFYEHSTYLTSDAAKD